MCNNTTHLIYTQSLSTQKGKTVTVKECVGTGEWLLSNQLILSGGARNVMQCNDYHFISIQGGHTQTLMAGCQKSKKRKEVECTLFSVMMKTKVLLLEKG